MWHNFVTAGQVNIVNSIIITIKTCVFQIIPAMIEMVNNVPRYHRSDVGAQQVLCKPLQLLNEVKILNILHSIVVVNVYFLMANMLGGVVIFSGHHHPTLTHIH